MRECLNVNGKSRFKFQVGTCGRSVKSILKEWSASVINRRWKCRLEIFRGYFS